MDTSGDSTLTICETGANDPEFLMTKTPLLILRKKAKDAVFATALETHGNFDAPIETTHGIYSRIQSVKTVYSDDTTYVVEITTAEKSYLFGVSLENKEHSVKAGGKELKWTGYSTLVSV